MESNKYSILSIKNIQFSLEKYNELIKLYSDFGELDKEILNFEKYNEIIEKIKDNINHDIFLYFDNSYNILGSITLLIEQKIIHNGGCILHIEDFVVNKIYRGKGIGNILIKYGIDYAKKNNCYKIILDCNDKLEKYYQSYGFIKKGTYMGLYF